MILADLLTAFVIALVISVIFVAAFGWRRPGAAEDEGIAAAILFFSSFCSLQPGLEESGCAPLALPSGELDGLGSCSWLSLSHCCWPPPASRIPIAGEWTSRSGNRLSRGNGSNRL